MTTIGTRELLIVDHSVRDSGTLLRGCHPGTHVCHLPYDAEPLATIASAASTLGSVERLTILAHGRPGAVLLAGQWLDTSALAENMPQLARIVAVLDRDAEVTLISCSSGSGAVGADFTATLERMLGVPVNAADADIGGSAGWQALPAALSTFGAPDLAAYPHRLVVTGTPSTGNDNLSSDGDADNIDALDGNDTIAGNGGNDTITGGAGNDSIDGGAGTDSLIGGTGNDTFVIDSNSDVIVENAGEGTDLVIVSGAHTLAGNVENLTIADGTGAIKVVGNSLDNVMTGTTSNNQISGEDGNDTIFAGGGSVNQLDGGAGNDSVSGSTGTDSINGADGNDTLIGAGGTDHLTGGAGNDFLSGDAGADVLSGGSGVDVLSGGSEGDTINATSADITGLAETIDGGDGTDLLQLNGGGAFDLTSASITAIEQISGSGSADSITATAAADSIDGAGAADILVGGAGNDTLLGGAGADTLSGGTGNDTLSGGDNADVLFGGTGNDLFTGSAAELNGDTISGLQAGDSIVVTSTNLSSLDGNTLGSTIDLGSETLNLSEAQSNLQITAAVSGGDTTLTFAVPSASNSSSGGSSSGSSGTGLSVTNQTTADTAGTATGRTLVNNSGGTATGALVQGTGNGNVVTATLPSGVSLTTSGTSSAVVGSSGGTTLTGEIQTTEPDVTDQSFLDGHGQTFLADHANLSLDIRSVTFSSTGSGGQTIQITGQSTGGSEAFVIDTGNLPTGSTLQLDNIEFAAIVGNATVTGGAGQNYVVGDDATQFISLGAEDDTLAGGGGDDTVGSGFGEDIVYGNQGADSVFGGGGIDTLYGGQDADTVFGGNDNDYVYGNKGDDTLSGGEDEDILFGGQDNDILYGNTGNDSLSGNLGDDTLYGGQGDDLLSGGDGNDLLVGNAGDDTLVGGDGADTFIFEFGGGDDRVSDFAAGTDTLALESGLGVAGATESDGNTTVTFSDGGTVTVVGVSKTDLAAATGWELG